MKKLLTVSYVLILVFTWGQISAAPTCVGPGNLGDGDISITGTGWNSTTQTLISGQNLATLNGGNPVALRGYVDLQDGADVAPSDWSKYYVKFQFRDNTNNRTINCVFADGNLGAWHGIPAQIWQRISLETEGIPGFVSNSPSGRESWYCRAGGCTDFGTGTCSNGRYTIYPTDEIYYVQLVADPNNGIFTLYAYGNGNGGNQAPPNSLNSTPGNKWWTIGSITLNNINDFDFTNVSCRIQLWSSTQASSIDVTNIHWYAAHLGSPLNINTDEPMPTRVWVDDNYAGGQPVTTPGWGVTRFDKIQNGINAVCGSTVNVMAGTYTENVTVNKSVTLQGPNYLIKGNDPGRLSEAIIVGGVKITSNDVTFEGFKINAGGSVRAIDESGSNVMIRNNILDGLTTSTVYAIYNGGATGLHTYTGNLIRNFTSSGWKIFFDGGINSQIYIDDNELSNMYSGIIFSGSMGNSIGEITNNIIDVTTWPAVALGASQKLVSGNLFTKGYVYITGHASNPGINYGNNNVITNNTFVGTGSTCVYFDNKPHAGNIVNDNAFLRTGASYFVTNLHLASSVDATCNWWGTSTICSMVPKISGNVNFIPFLTNGTDNAPATIGFQPVPGSCNGAGGVVTNLNTGKWFCTIQSAINDATTLNTHTILAFDGTYPESPVVNKSLTIKSLNGRNVTTIQNQTAPTYVGALEINADNVTIDGFTFEGYDAVGSGTASTNIAVVDGDNAKIANCKLRVGKIGPGTTGDDGFGIVTYYNDVTDICNKLEVLNTIFEPLNTEGQRAFYINPGVGQFIFKNNSISGNFVGRAMTQAKTSTIESNNITGTGTSAGIGTWGYPDPTIWGHATISGNSITNTNTAIKIYSSNMVNVKNNILNSNGYGVQVLEYYGTFDPTSILINNNIITGNSTYGVENSTTFTVNAEYNWWGDCSGPDDDANIINGSGDKTSLYVDATPWLGGSLFSLSSYLHLDSYYFFMKGHSSGTPEQYWSNNWCPDDNLAVSPDPYRYPAYTISSPPMVEFGTNLSVQGHNWGASDVMQINYDANITSGVADIMTPTAVDKTLFVVFKPEADANNGRQVIFEAGETTSGFNIYTDNDNVCFGMWNRLERMFLHTGMPSLTMGQYYLAQLEYNATKKEFRAVVNGSIQSPVLPFSGLTKDPDDGSGQPSVGIAGEVLGTRFHDYNIRTNNYSHTYNGGIGDVILFNSHLDATKLGEVYAYFNSKYGTSWTAPAEYIKRGDWKVFSDVETNTTLSEAWPNPFTTKTSFSVMLPVKQHVRIELINSYGELIQVLYEGVMDGGIVQDLTIDGANLPSGLYVYRVMANGFNQSGKVILTK